MKPLRFALTHKPFSRLARLFLWIDGRVVCMQHRHSRKAALATLRQASCFGARQTLAALESIRADPAIERERSRLLARSDLLSDRGPYDRDWTVSAAAAISKSPKLASLLGAMTRAFAPQHVVELGTNVGVSAAYLAAAIDGTVCTLEASPARMKLAREMHRNLGLGNVEYVEGYFSDTLKPLLERMSFVDFSFIDGHHEYQPTVDYCSTILPYARPGTVLFFDDIRFSPGMWKAWSELSSDDRFGLVVDFWSMGACVVRKEDGPQVRVEPIACF